MPENNFQPQFDTTFIEELLNFLNQEIIAFNEMQEAIQFKNQLERISKQTPQFAAQEPTLFARLQETLVKLRWIVLSSLPASEILDLFEKHLVESFTIPYFDLWLKFRAKLASLILYPERDKLKKRVQEALLRNKQELTQEGVIIGTRERPGTVLNWLTNYNQKLGTAKVTRLDFNQYVTNTLREFSAEDKGRVRILLDFYERLKYSSLDPAGVEDSMSFIDSHDGHLKVFREGVVDDVEANKQLNEIIKRLQVAGIWPKEEEPAAGKEDKNEPVDSILIAYNTLPVPLAQIRQEMVDLNKRLRLNPSMIEQILADPSKVNDQAYLVAALLLAARAGRLAGHDLRSTAGLAFFRSRVREILEKQLGWGAEDGAKLGIRIGHILGGEIKQWAYYDKSKGEFRWTEW